MQLVIIVKWSVPDPANMFPAINAIYDMHKDNVKAIAMTGTDGNAEVHTVMIRKRSVKELKFPTCINVMKVWTLKLTGMRGATHDAIMDAMYAATMCGYTSYRNFDFQKIDTHSLESVEAEFDQLTYAQIDNEIIRSKALAKHERSARDSIIISVGEKLLARRREDEKSVCSKKLCSEVHYELNTFVGLDDVQVLVCDPVTCTHAVYPFTDFWKLGLFSDTCLIMCGGSSLGKSQLGKTMCQILAMKLQRDKPDPYYIVAGTVDSLRSAVKDGFLKSEVPIIFDDLTPGEPQGSRPPMELSNVIKFLEMDETTSVHARNNDILLPKGIPKIVTTNAREPHEWHPKLPKNFWSMSPEDRQAQPNLVRAVFKRTAWCVIEHPLFADEEQQAAKRARRAEGAALMADVFA